MNSRQRIHPLFALVVLALVPAIVLSLGWYAAQAAADRHYSHRVGLGLLIDPTAPEIITATEVAAHNDTLATQLLSWRRGAHAVSHQLNFTTFVEEVDRVGALLNQSSCLAVSVNGQMTPGHLSDLAAIPASVIKILIAGVALDTLGEDFRYVTTLKGRLDPDGVIRGGLQFIGGGDPLLSGDWYVTSGLERNPVFHHTSVDEMVQQLVDLGVVRIEGDVVGVADRYDAEFFVPNWGQGVAGVEAGPYAALIVNDARVRGDSLRSSDPVLGAARELIRLLAERNISVLGSAVSDYTGAVPVDPDAVELVRAESAPLSAVVEEMLTNSDNNTAELMLKEIGYQAVGQGTRAAGQTAVVERLRQWGIATETVVIDDGSGLSPGNLLSCDAVLTVLNRFGVDSALSQGLAVAGRTGTLSQIFTDDPVQGRLRAKTGTLNNPPFDRDPPAVKGLAGYLPLQGGGSIEFSLILNGPTISDQREYRPIWERLMQVFNAYPYEISIEELGPR
jgi:D-alanyl-D-alanine carboxypeptidase/D-alanyl-D-alanine-endopeptidase (penicillin-binding protein 4)